MLCVYFLESFLQYWYIILFTMYLYVLSQYKAKKVVSSYIADFFSDHSLFKSWDS